MRFFTRALTALMLLLSMQFSSTFAQEILSEDFATYEGNAPDPAGWNEWTGVATPVDEDSHWSADASNYISAEKSAKFGFNAWNSDPVDAWLLSPTLDLTQNGGTNRLSFMYKSGKLLGANDYIEVKISVDNGATFSSLETIQMGSSDEWMQKNIDLSAFNQTDVQLAFYAHDDTEEDVYTSFYIDNVVVENIPDYDYAVLPNSINHNTFADTTVFSGDVINFGAALYSYGLQTASTPVKWSVDGGTPATANETSGSIDYLNTINHTFSAGWTAPNEPGVYTLKLYTDHADDVNHLNDTVSVKVTVYPPYTEFTENFDASTEWPLGWLAYPTGGYDLLVTNDSYNANSAPNCVKFNSGAEKGYTLLTPAVDVNGSDAYRLTTWMRGSAGAKMAIGYVSNFQDTSSFVALDTVEIETSYQNFPYELVFSSANVKQLAYVYLNTGEYIYLDDISFEKVLPYDLSIDAINENRVIPAGESFRYAYKLRNKGFNQETFDLEATGDWTYTIFDNSGQTEISNITLNSEQVDTVYLEVQSPSEISDIVTDNVKLSMTSQTEPEIYDSVVMETSAYLPYSVVEEGFEDNEEIPFAWTSLDSEGNINVYNSSYSANSGTNYVQFSNAPAGTMVSLATPKLQSAQLYRMSFYQKGDGVLIVGTTPTLDNFDNFDTLGSYSSSYSYQLKELTFSAADEGLYIVFKHEVDGGYNSASIDDISIELVPPYAVEVSEYDPGTFVPAGMSTNYMVSLTNMGTENETFNVSGVGDWTYSVYDKELNDQINTITIEPGATDTVFMEVQVDENGITDGQVDSASFIVASSSDISAADSVHIVTTSYNPINTLNESFEASGALPDYWDGLKFYSYSDFGVTTYSGNTGSNSAKIHESSSAEGKHTYLTTPVLMGNQSYKLAFYTKCYSEGDFLMVGTMSNAKDTATFELIDTISVASTFIADTLDVNLDENRFIAFVTAVDGKTINIDDITLQQLPQASISPSNGAEHVSVDTEISISFNNNIQNLDGSAVSNEDLNSFITFKMGDENGTDVPFSAVINDLKTNVTITPAASLEGESTYYLSFADQVVQDTNEYKVPGAQSTFTTADIDAPVFENGYPVATNIDETNFVFEVSLNETGSVSYIVVEASAQEPTVNQVLAGEDYGTVSIHTSGVVPVTNAGVVTQEAIDNLMISTAYSVYMVAQDDAPAVNTQSAVTQLDVTTLDDLTAPEFEPNYPNVSNIDLTAFDINVQLNEPGKVFYIVIDAGEQQPTISEVVAGEDYSTVTVVANGTIEVAETSTSYAAFVENLQVGTDYEVYLVAEDDQPTPNIQETLAMLEVTTLSDEVAPEFTESYPEFTDVTDTTFNLHVQLNESGTVYYVVVDDEVQAPSSEEVKAGEAYAGVNVIASGSVEVEQANATETSGITDLTPNTSYDVYVVAEDNATDPNLQSEPVMVEVTTTNYTNIENYAFESKVYPNPTSGLLHVSSTRQFHLIKIFDVKGELISIKRFEQTNKFDLNLDNLTQGMYLVQILSVDGYAESVRIQKF
ncbi:hypothetical protein L21SP5_02585 [Salinivirga cyanobacteriivorans]|uniref:Cadherin domain-containing protein n=1 Tax=Salinivirga cyanobacteriivorans TaxID=1307839 RepID=A0A0S2I1L3_9BACT|nr:choice-of-anchor J domain-containing protein [Salinivirga cyanobacteriivorans]ALO16208.1 hypothetical protein L21SP5_02585 [Salinivirga cyanobacteriivorans]